MAMNYDLLLRHQFLMHKSPIFLVLEKMNFYRTSIKAYIHPDVNMPPYYIILYQLSYPGKDD